MRVLQAALFVAFVAGGAFAKDTEEKDSSREGRGLSESLAGISSTIKGLNQLNQINSLVQGVNVSEITEASTRVAKELSKSLKIDVFAAGKALAGAGAAVGSVVFLGGMAALLATGLGFFNYSPRLYETAYPYVNAYQNRVGQHPGVLTSAQQAVYQRVQQAQQQYAGQQGKTPTGAGQAQSQFPVYHGAPHQQGQAAYGEVSARTARILEETKKPANPELMPAITDLLTKISLAANAIGPQVAEEVIAAAKRR